MYIPDIPNNNLKPQLEELVYIASKIDTEVSEDDKYSLIFYFNASATEEEIKNLEKEIDTSLPIGYKEFLFFLMVRNYVGIMPSFLIPQE